MIENNKWRMWYASGTKWIALNDRPESLYKIKYCHSSDGIHWKRENITCIEPKTSLEANVRPSVIKENNKYKMWFCYRGSYDFRDGKDSYRIGYAESLDGIHWTRKDEMAGLEYYDQEWDKKNASLSSSNKSR